MRLPGTPSPSQGLTAAGPSLSRKGRGVRPKASQRSNQPELTIFRALHGLLMGQQEFLDVQAAGEAGE